MTLGLCMIAKNEERHLDRCLASVRGLVDDILVVDAGSTDRTIEIALAHGARVRHFAWQDDFSLAHNFSLDHAATDWILSLDADESIAARDHSRIRECVAREGLDAVMSLQRNYLNSGSVVGWQPGSGGYDEGRPYSGYFDVACRRLFRNRPWLRFRNPVHEELCSTDPNRPLIEAQSDWVIHHYGKADQRAGIEMKGETYLRIGRKKVEDFPADPLAHYELGIQYRELDRPGEALPWFEKAVALSPHFRDSELQIAICRIRLKEYDQALTALRYAARHTPQYAAEAALEEGNVYQKTGDVAAAERAFKRAIDAKPYYGPACVNLALLFCTQRRFSDALTYLDQAIAHNPNHYESRVVRAQTRFNLCDYQGALDDLAAVGSRTDAARLRARILARQRRFAEARASLDDFAGPADADVLALRGAIALGLGQVDEAIELLRRSLDLGKTVDAAINLSAALNAKGDACGALDAAARALQADPAEPVAISRFSHLAGDRFRHPDPSASARPLRFFFYQPHSIPFDARTPRERGLGGTESAIVYLGEALVRRGHRVVVFNGCDEAGTYHGVEYARWESMPIRILSDRADVLVAVRAWELLGLARFAPLQLFWTCDAFDQQFVRSLSDPAGRREIDFVILHSDWQEDTFRQHHRLPGWQIARTVLGAAASIVEPPLRPEARMRSRRLAYASTPFRGLDVLLDVFPRIRAACPDAELDVYSSMRVYGVSEKDDREQNATLYRKAQQPGVRLVGSLPQQQLAVRLAEARVLAYPNHYAETFCIAAVEAQAAGCAVVTSALGALPETVGSGGICLPGSPHSASYQRAFVDECVRLLVDDERWLALSTQALERSWRLYAWPRIAEEWETLCRAALGRPDAPVLARAAAHMAAGRDSLALKMIERESAPAGIPPDAWDGVKQLAGARAGVSTPPSEQTLRRVAICVPAFRNASLLGTPDRAGGGTAA